jgi:osmotically-inducible protein OsmY
MNKIKRIPTLILAGVLTTALGCTGMTSQDKSSTTTRESTGQYVDDTIITAKVKAAVLQEPMLKSYEINVETYKGVVQLSGFVSSQAEINKAVELTRTIKGVTSVKNNMLVKPK